MKEIKLFVDFEFTSLSPDAQLISVGIVCENKAFITPVKDETQNDIISNFCVGSFRQDFSGHSFYAEFTDFDISRCDDWVRNNVVSKLQNIDTTTAILNGEIILGSKDSHKLIMESITCHLHDKFTNIWFALKWWLSQFSDYKIQFVVDCGTWDWYWLLQLLAEWDLIENKEGFKGSCPTCHKNGVLYYKQGLPKLADNISPVPMDLNDLIAFKKGISVSEAFDLNREQLAFGRTELSENEKHNALWDAKVIKTIYEQLNS